MNIKCAHVSFSVPHSLSMDSNFRCQRAVHHSTWPLPSQHFVRWRISQRPRLLKLHLIYQETILNPQSLQMVKTKQRRLPGSKHRGCTQQIISFSPFHSRMVLVVELVCLQQYSQPNEVLDSLETIDRPIVSCMLLLRCSQSYAQTRSPVTCHRAISTVSLQGHCWGTQLQITLAHCTTATKEKCNDKNGVEKKRGREHCSKIELVQKGQTRENRNPILEKGKRVHVLGFLVSIR